MIFPSWMIPLITEERGVEQDDGHQFQWPQCSHMLSAGHIIFYNTGILTLKVSLPESPMNYSKPSSCGNLEKYAHLEKAIIRHPWWMLMTL